MNPLVSTRNATTKDASEISVIKPELTSGIINDRLQQQILGNVEFLIAEIEGHKVGFVLLKWKGKETHPEYPGIEDLYIAKSERDKGYGSSLIKECEHRARQKGFTKIGMAVNPTNNKLAVSLYSKLGYHPTGEKSYIDGVYNGVEDWCIDMDKDI